jgi:4-azaleucine resistance transporter AzlC
VPPIDSRASAPIRPRTDFIRGLRLGLPIALGYFSAAVAFGILARSLGLGAFEAIFFSMSNFAGASQFMAVKMIANGSRAAELLTAVLMVNARYFLMSASLSRRLEASGIWKKLVAAFGTTDESFAVGSGEEAPLPFVRFLGIEIAAYSGWVGGTAAGALAGSFLPPSLQAALSGSLYAFFAALLGPALKKAPTAAIGAAFAAGLNCLLYFAFHWPIGWAMVAAIAGGTTAAFAAGEARLAREAS